MSGYCTKSDHQDGGRGQKCCKCICFSPLCHTADWELWLTATAQHGEKVAYLASLTQERSKFKTRNTVSTYSILLLKHHK